ncbi:tetratricopeptide repeat protein [Kribbella endophytica]
MLATARAVLIRYTRGGQPRRGSGLRIGADLVLTADHCADGTNHRIFVDGSGYPAVVSVRSNTAAVDIAVLQGVGLPEVENSKPVLVDRSIAARLEDCVALGFPVWKDKPGDPSRAILAQVAGSVPTAEGRDPSSTPGAVPLLTLKLSDPPAQHRTTSTGGLDTAGTHWAGMSGAAVVTAHGLLVGVVRSHNLAEGSSSLSVTSLGSIDDLPPETAARFWSALGVADSSLLPWLPGPVEPVPDLPVSSEQVVVGEMPSEPIAFVERETVDRLAATSVASGIVVVCAVTGQRGVGKTQVAAAYARACVRDGWRFVAWVNAESGDTLLKGLANAARSLRVDDPDGDSTRSAQRLRDHLQTRPERGLLIFDNATDPDDLLPYLPAVGRTQIVITSTNLAFHAVGQSVDVEAYTRSESIRYLNERAKRNDVAGASAVAHELGDLPLALAQAAATLSRQRHLSYLKYLDRLRRLPVEAILGRTPGEAYPRSTAAALLMSIDAVESLDNSDMTGRVLAVFSLLSHDGVRQAFFSRFRGAGAEPEIDAVLERCVAGSLLTWSVAGDALIMHRLLARVLRDRSHHGEQGGIAVRDAVHLIQPWLFDSTMAWQRRTEGAELIGHIEALWEYGTLDNSERSLTWTVLQARTWAVRQLMAAADSTRAIDLAKDQVAASQRVLGTDHSDTLICRNDLAGAYESAGRLDDAIPLFEQNLADRTRVLGTDHPDTLSSRNNLAGAYESAGRLDDAIPLYEQTFADSERVLGPDHPDTLTSRNNLAYTYRSAGRLGDAVALLEQNLADRIRVLGTDHPDTLTSRNNLAGAYESAGRPGDAIPLFEQNFADRTRDLGTDHPDTLTSRNNLASAYKSAGRLDDAIPLFEQNLADRTRVLGTDHPDVLTSRNNLAGAYESAGRLDDAISLYEQNLADLERVLGPDHPNTLSAGNNLAYAYESAGRLDDAIPLFEQNLADRTRVLGTDHPDTLASRHNLSSTYKSAGRLDDAIPVFEQNLAEYERILGPNHPDTLTSRNSLASAYRSAGRIGDAVSLLAQNLADSDRLLGPNHPSTRIYRDNLASAKSAADRTTS